MATKIKNPIIKKVSDNGAKAKVTFIDGRNYDLQHPGNRAYMEWQKENFNITEGFDNQTMLDNFFEHCVFPDGHDFRPDLDNISPAEATAWSKFMHKFLSGEIQVIAESSMTTGKKKEKPDTES